MTVGLDTELLFCRMVMDSIAILAILLFSSWFLVRLARRWRCRTVWLACDRRLAERLQREDRE